MNIRDEELLHRYFERQMSNAEEQNFLIDVAARDDMRVAFRSQLELVKAVRLDKDALPGAAFVRERTLGALGFAGVVLPSLLDDEATAAVTSSGTSRVGAWLRKPLALLSGGLLVGSIATFSVMNAVQTENVSPAATVAAPTAPSEIRITLPEEVSAPVSTDITTASEPAATNKTKTDVRRSVEGENIVNSKPAELRADDEQLPMVTTSRPAEVTLRKPRIITPSK
jgi:hypothetical protein